MARRQGAKACDASDVLKNLRSLMDDTPMVKEVALRETAKIARAEIRKIVPVKDGFLYRGVKYRVRRVGGAVEFEAIISASSRDGGATHEYALIVHEDLEQPHAFGKEAKFVESVIKQLQANRELLQQLDSNVRKRFATKYGFRLPSTVDTD